MGKHVYAPVWISSQKHLEQFSTCTKPLWRKLLGIYSLPPDFPRTILMGRALPIVFFGHGELTLYERQMDFRSTLPDTLPNARYANINPAIHFDLAYEQVLKVDRYKVSNSFLSYFAMNWIRINVHHPVPGEELLLCVGGKGPDMKKLHQKTDELYGQIVQKLEHKAQLVNR